MLDLAARRPEAAFWVHGAWLIDRDDRRVGAFSPPFGGAERLVPGDEALGRLLVQNTIAIPAPMFRRQAVLDLGGLDEDLWYTADWDLWLKLARTGDVAWSPARLAAFRIHAQSLSITGSQDHAGFLRQLAIPLDRHLGGLPAGRGAAIRRRAEFSNALNVYLARRYHGAKGGGLKLAGDFLRLGPAGWAGFLRDSRIVQRVVPRLKLAFRRPAAPR
jgi:hypothetical protein